MGRANLDLGRHSVLTGKNLHGAPFAEGEFVDVQIVFSLGDNTPFATGEQFTLTDVKLSKEGSKHRLTLEVADASQA